MHYRTKTHTHNSGMTLAELIVILTIYTLLMLVITLSIQSVYQYNRYSIAQANEIDNARRGIDTWTRNSREMRYSDDGAFPVNIKEDHRFGFYSNVDSDSDVEYVEYELTNTTLLRHTHDPVGTPPSYDLATPDRTDIISEFVQNLSAPTSTFRYFDTDGLPLGVSDPFVDVRYIQVYLLINIDPTSATSSYVLRSSVAPRNLKDNL